MARAARAQGYRAATGAARFEKEECRAERA
jgi:hypothetical protein